MRLRLTLLKRVRCYVRKPLPVGCPLSAAASLQSWPAESQCGVDDSEMCERLWDADRYKVDDTRMTAVRFEIGLDDRGVLLVVAVLPDYRFVRYDRPRSVRGGAQ